MTTNDPPTCRRCGLEAWSVNEWCPNHPWGWVVGPGQVVTYDGKFEEQEEASMNVTMLFDTRPSWDAVWMDLADNIARRSKCTRSQVGAVIVDVDQNVISTSYNGPPRGFDANGPCTNWCPRSQGTDDPSPTYDDCVAAHAEANAITRADYSRMQGATLYASTSCCKGCAKQIANSGIVRVVYRNEQGRAYRNPEATVEFFEQCGVQVDEYED